MYCRVQEADNRSKADKSKIFSLQRTIEGKDDEIKALKTRESALQNIIRKQGEYISKIKGRLQFIAIRLEGLQNQVRPKSLIEKIKGLFSKEKEVGALPPAQECAYLKEQSDASIQECDMSEQWTKQNSPLSVEQIMREQAKAKSKGNIIERNFEDK